MPFNLQTLKELTRIYLPLAFTTFGGPSAHIAIFHDIFVTQKKWLNDVVFAELFAIAQSLPGPASTQLAYSITLMRDGVLAGIYSFLLWSVPGMILMTLIGLGILQFTSSNTVLPPFVISIENGLTSCAVGLVAVAACKLSNKLLNSSITVVLALMSFSCTIYFVNWPWLSPTLMLTGGLIHILYTQLSQYSCAAKKATGDEEEPLLTNEPSTSTLSTSQQPEEQHHSLYLPQSDLNSNLHQQITPTHCILMITVWFALLILSVYARTSLNQSWSLLGTFYFTGSIIFGGGPVVIPLLNAYVVSNGWMSEKEFLIGLAIIQALPGPMFNFAAYCGAMALRATVWTSIYGSLLAWFGIFFPGLLLKTALIPLWTKYRQLSFIQQAMKGINAVAVGLVYAAVFLLWNKAITNPHPSHDDNAHPIQKDHDYERVLGMYPYFVIVTAISFVSVGYLNVPAPLSIILSGVLGYIS